MGKKLDPFGFKNTLVLNMMLYSCRYLNWYQPCSIFFRYQYKLVLKNLGSSIGSTLSCQLLSPGFNSSLTSFLTILDSCFNCSEWVHSKWILPKIYERIAQVFLSLKTSVLKGLHITLIRKQSHESGKCPKCLVWYLKNFQYMCYITVAKRLQLKTTAEMKIHTVDK